MHINLEVLSYAYKN